LKPPKQRRKHYHAAERACVEWRRTAVVAMRMRTGDRLQAGALRATPLVADDDAVASVERSPWRAAPPVSAVDSAFRFCHCGTAVDQRQRPPQLRARRAPEGMRRRRRRSPCRRVSAPTSIENL